MSLSQYNSENMAQSSIIYKLLQKMPEGIKHDLVIYHVLPVL